MNQEQVSLGAPAPWRRHVLLGSAVIGFALFYWLFVLGGAAHADSGVHHAKHAKQAASHADRRADAASAHAGGHSAARHDAANQHAKSPTHADAHADEAPSAPTPSSAEPAKGPIASTLDKAADKTPTPPTIQQAAHQVAPSVDTAIHTRSQLAHQAAPGLAPVIDGATDAGDKTVIPLADQVIGGTGDAVAATMAKAQSKVGSPLPPANPSGTAPAPAPARPSLGSQALQVPPTGGDVRLAGSPAAGRSTYASSPVEALKSPGTTSRVASDPDLAASAPAAHGGQRGTPEQSPTAPHGGSPSSPTTPTGSSSAVLAGLVLALRPLSRTRRGQARDTLSGGPAYDPGSSPD